MSNAERLKRVTGQRTLIAGAFELGRMMGASGRSLHSIYPTKWRASLRRAFFDGFQSANNPQPIAPPSWRCGRNN